MKILGCGYLLTGYLSKKSFKVPTSVHINSMGAFLLIYNCLNSLLLLSMFYQFGNRESWLHASDSVSQFQQAKAPLWLYIFHPFVEILCGVVAATWACIPKLKIGICRKEPIKQVSHHKPPSQIKYQQSPYHAASYQTICPPNSCVSSMISMSTITKNTGSRKYPHYSSSQYCHSHGRRSRSSYRMTGMPVSTIGTETVL